MTCCHAFMCGIPLPLRPKGRLPAHDLTISLAVDDFDEFADDEEGDVSIVR